MLFVARQSAEGLLEVVGFYLARRCDGLIREHFGQQGSRCNARRTALRFKTGGDDLIVCELEIEVQQVAAHGIGGCAFMRRVGQCAGVAWVIKVIEDGKAIQRWECFWMTVMVGHYQQAMIWERLVFLSDRVFALV